MLSDISPSPSSLPSIGRSTTGSSNSDTEMQSLPSHDGDDPLKSWRLLPSPNLSHQRCLSSAPSPVSILQISLLHTTVEPNRPARTPCTEDYASIGENRAMRSPNGIESEFLALEMFIPATSEPGVSERNVSLDQVPNLCRRSSGGQRGRNHVSPFRDPSHCVKHRKACGVTSGSARRARRAYRRCCWMSRRTIWIWIRSCGVVRPASAVRMANSRDPSRPRRRSLGGRWRQFHISVRSSDGWYVNRPHHRGATPVQQYQYRLVLYLIYLLLPIVRLPAPIRRNGMA
jgi:hypothetical protein